MDRPGVRGRYMGTFLAHVNALPERGAIRAAIDSERLAAMEGATSFFDWLPVEDNLLATHAVADVLGPRRTHDFFVALQYAELDTPLFSWVRKLTPTMHEHPERTLGWIAKGYGLMFRNAGTWRVVDATANAAVLEMVGLPEVMTRDAVWLSSVGSSLNAIFRVADVDGAVTLGADPGPPRYKLRWT